MYAEGQTGSQADKPTLK